MNKDIDDAYQDKPNPPWVDDIGTDNSDIDISPQFMIGIIVGAVITVFMMIILGVKL